MDRERAERDLAAIRSLMEESRGQISGTGRHWIVWGVVTVAGLLGTWGALRGALALDPLWIWCGLLPLAWAASVWMGRRESGVRGVRNELTRVVHSIWFGLGVGLTILGVGGMFSPLVDSHILPGLFCAVIGAGIFATGAVPGLGWLRWVAGGWWLGGVGLMAAPGGYALPLMAVMVLALQVVPGVVLERRAWPSPGSPTREPA